jgi:hypothetical protein
MQERAQKCLDHGANAKKASGMGVSCNTYEPSSCDLVCLEQLCLTGFTGVQNSAHITLIPQVATPESQPGPDSPITMEAYYYSVLLGCLFSNFHVFDTENNVLFMGSQRSHGG